MIDEGFQQNSPKPGRRWIFAHCEYIESSRQLLVHGAPVKIEAKPLNVLQHLLENPTRVHTKDELLGANWDTATTDQSLATAISKLRTAFGVSREEIILTVSGIGYRLAVPVICKVDVEPGMPRLRLKKDDPIPGKEKWIADRGLDSGENPKVWVAEHHKTHEAHVFKFAVDGVRLRALQREVAISRVLQQVLERDERFLRIIDWNFEQAPYFTESEYCGLNLFEFSETEDCRRMPVDERVAIAAQIAGAISAAHNLGIIHNDLKPSNILLLRRSTERDKSPELGVSAKDWQIKIVDFGVASLDDPASRLQDMDITDHGQFDTADQTDRPVGTAMYRAPELRKKGATPNTLGDIYALGVILYQMISGDFLGAPSIGWEARVSDALLRDDVATAAHNDPEQRLSSAGDLAESLRNIEARREELRKRDAESAEKQRAERIAARHRIQRPWILTALIALAFGLGTSLIFYRNAVRQRDLATSLNTTLTAMLSFLTDDLLSQTDPLAASSGNGENVHETLLAAIHKALPQIDHRFAQSPGVAARLHSTIGTALNSQLAYTEADAQFELAAKRFREAEGPLSQNAIIAELQRENAELGSRVPGSLAKATAAFAEQQKLIQRIPSAGPELQAWQALNQSGILIFGENPEKALPILNQAVQRAQKSPGFPPKLLLMLELRSCSPYMFMRDGPNMERVARAVIATASSLYGADTPALFEPEMFLQEALYIQGKYKETVAQANYNYAQFSRILGPANQLTLDALDNRGGAEGMLEDFPAAVRDELAVYEAAKTLPAGKYLELDTLNDASMHECRAGQYDSGNHHAREVMDQSGPSAGAQPEFANTSLFNLAECLISQQEASGAKRQPSSLAEAGTLLNRIDLPLLAKLSHSDDFNGNVYVAEARLALLLNQHEIAGKYAEQAEPFMQRPSADPYERRMFRRVQDALRNSSK